MFQWPTLFMFCAFIFRVHAAPAKLTAFNRNFLPHGEENEKQSESTWEDYKFYNYTQTLDHYNYNPQSYDTFNQTYVINSKYWGGADSNSPIFAYLGEEAALVGDVSSIGVLKDNAPSFKALMVYIEHRFYGSSIPYGIIMEKAMKNESIRGYFSSAQAIADYAEILLYVKRKLSAMNSPIIVVGGSYGGMLASWFRLKYPHIALGALASSAPILYFDNIIPSDKGYYSIVSKDFKEASPDCYKIIKRSWSEIEKVAARENGLSILSKKFKTCKKLNQSSDLKDYLETFYSSAAQYNSPPDYPVTQVCGGINGAPKGSDVLGRIYAGLVALKGNASCYDVNEYNYPTQTNIGWAWQTCSEMVMPIGIGKDSMLPPDPFDINNFTKTCQKKYGVSPRPHWITTYYGGHDIKLILRRFASNIIFSNGLRDPYSSGGVLNDISDSVVSISTKNGSHCLDILPARKDDPEWLIEQRKRELTIIRAWLKEYYVDLDAIKQ